MRAMHKMVPALVMVGLVGTVSWHFGAQPVLLQQDAMDGMAVGSGVRFSLSLNGLTFSTHLSALALTESSLMFFLSHISSLPLSLDGFMFCTHLCAFSSH